MTEQTPETVTVVTDMPAEFVDEKATFRSHFTKKRITIAAAATAAAVTVLYLKLKKNEDEPLFVETDDTPVTEDDIFGQLNGTPTSE